VATTIGIDLGGTKLLTVRMVDREVVAESSVSTPGDADQLSDAAIDAARAVWSDDVGAVGIGVAGLVEYPSGVFVWGPHVAGTRVPVRADVEEALGVPVVVDNDANTGARAEYRLGAAQGSETMVFVTLGTGIGGAIVIDGEVMRGTSFAGEFGHMRYEPNGLECACGKRGCWETLASGPALVRLATDHVEHNPQGPLAQTLGRGPISGEMVTAAAESGDETARRLVAQVGKAFGEGLCSLVAALDPDIIVVGGGLGSVGESLLGPARLAAADLLHGGPHRDLPPIVVAGLGARAGAVGAALMAEDLVSDRTQPARTNA
jgi:glucokinase